MIRHRNDPVLITRHAHCSSIHAITESHLSILSKLNMLNALTRMLKALLPLITMRISIMTMILTNPNIAPDLARCFTQINLILGTD